MKGDGQKTTPSLEGRNHAGVKVPLGEGILDEPAWLFSSLTQDGTYGHHETTNVGYCVMKYSWGMSIRFVKEV